MRRNQSVDHFSSVIVLQDLLVGHGGYSIVVKLVPPSIGFGLDEGKVVSPVQVSRVD